MLYINDSIPTKHLHWENVWNICERAERASFKNLAFSHSNTAISLNNLLVLQILCFRNIFNFRCQHSPYIYNHQINAVSFYYSWYGAIYKRQYTDKTLTLRKCMCMRASEASELRKFRYFYILKLLFLSIFCRYIRGFVGTNDMLVGLHVPTNLSMYRQISKCTDKSPKRHYWGGGAIACPPPPPSGYANVVAAESERKGSVSITYYKITESMHGYIKEEGGSKPTTVQHAILK